MSRERRVDRYVELLSEIKSRIAGAQIRAALAANQELLKLYWDIGRMIDARRTAEGWGARVIPRLARDLAAELHDAKGFSERNLHRMVQFYQAYPMLTVASEVSPQPVAELERRAGPSSETRPESPSAAFSPQPVAETRASTSQPELEVVSRPSIEGAPHPSTAETCARLSLDIPWGHNILLLQKVANATTRAWYMHRCIEEGWSRDVLGLMIKSQTHLRHGAATTNFETRLPAPQSDLARQTIKSPYLFDFLTLDAGFRERELERGLLAHLEHFLLELGVGFAFVGRQHHIKLGGDDFYLDLLFYHLKLRSFVVIDLKVGPFKAEYAGKMNLYLNLVDDTLRHPADQPSIGLILCQDQKRILAEYALRGMDKPIGVSEYELTRALPAELQSALPTVDEIEAELAQEEGDS